MAPGRQIGPYELVSRLGRGAMGEVWEAEGKGGIWALKIPRRPEYLRHLQREGDLLKQIQHPRVARLFEANLDEEIPYLVMEYVKAKPLRTFCNGKISSSEATLLCDQILDGLEAIHRAGYIHLDLKPENVLVDESGAVKIVDLGLGRATSNLMQEVYLSASLISRDLPLAGTLAYMAPEQRKGKDLDPRTDLFAFGVLLHELLSGHLPDPTFRISQIREDLPPRWDVVISKLTHPQMAYRPSSAKEARQLVSFTLSVKEVLPVAEGGIEPRDLSILDQKAMEYLSPYRSGMTVGRCLLEDILGRGGYGEVWRAKRAGEPVAIKMALRDDVKTALVGEASLMALLDSPAIPKILEDCTRENPSHIVLELIEGQSLRFLLNEEEKLPWELALNFFRAMVEAVYHCHEEGVIHRDLKPEHFVVLPEGRGEDFPLRLIDFGLAGLVNQGQEQKSFHHSLATGDHIGGTFDYMAPEQRKGQTGPEVDIYSLGVCLFEMISGSLPRGPQRLKMLCKEVPERLDSMVTQMLDQMPQRRPGLEEILETLEDLKLKGSREVAPMRKRFNWRENRYLQWLVDDVLIDFLYPEDWTRDSKKKLFFKLSLCLLIELILSAVVFIFVFGLTLVVMLFI